MQKRRRRVIAGNQGVRVGPKAFGLFKKLRDTVYQFKIIGKGEAQYLFDLKKKRKKQYDNAEEIEMVINKPVTLTGYYDETLQHDPYIDSIFNSEKITKIELTNKFANGEINVTRAFYISRYGYNEQGFNVDNVEEIPLENLTEIRVNNNVENYSDDSNGYGLYDKEKETLLYYANGLSEFEIDNATTTIESMAVAKRGILETAEIPDNITSVNTISFYDCYNLKTLRVPKSVTTVGGRAFKLCPVETLYIACNVRHNNSTTDGWSYWFKDTLQYLEVYDNEITSIVAEEFRDCLELKEVILFDNIEILNGRSFMNCIKIENMTMGWSFNSYSFDVFYNAFARVINDSRRIECDVYNKNYYTYYYKDGDNYIAINNVGSPGEFRIYKEQYGNLYLPQGIGVLNLYWIPNTQSSGSLQGMGDYAGLKSSYLDILNLFGANMDANGWNIPRYSFYLSAMRVVNIYNVKNIQIKDYAFRECQQLESFNFKPITKIGIWSFYGCISLKSSGLSIDSAEIIENYNEEIFTYYYKNENNYYIPINNIQNENDFNDAKLIYNELYKIDNINGLIFDDNLTIIDNGAFSSCYAIENIYIPKNVEQIGYEDSYATLSLIAFEFCIGIKHVLYNCQKICRSDISSLNPSSSIPCYAMFYYAGNNEFILHNTYDNSIQYYYYLKDNIYNQTGRVYNISDFNTYKNRYGDLYAIVSKETPLEPNVILEIGEDVLDIPGLAFSYFNFNNILIIPDNIYGIGISAFAYAGTIGVEFSKSFQTDSYVPTHTTSSTTSVSISGKYRIESSVFAHCENLTVAKLNKNMLTLPTSMFSYSGIHELSVDDENTSESEITDVDDTLNLTYIQQVGKTCFSYCQNLESIIFGEFPNLYEESFSNCYNLSYIEVKGDNYFDEYEEAYSFSPTPGCSGAMVCYLLENDCYNRYVCETQSRFNDAISLFGHLYTKTSSNVLSNNAFLLAGKSVAENNDTVKLVYSNNATMSYGLVCFNGSYITEIDFGDVKSMLPYSSHDIMGYIFESYPLLYLPKLKKMTSKSITYIPYMLFYGSLGSSTSVNKCPELEEIRFNEVKIIGNNAFAYSPNLKTLYLPKLEETYSACFYSCQSIVNVSLPNLITDHDGGFMMCQSLRTVSIPKAQNLSSTFGYCSSLSSVSISQTPIVMNWKLAFEYCESLPQSFFNTQLASALAPGSNISASTFTRCKLMKNNILPDNFTISSVRSMLSYSNYNLYNYGYNLFQSVDVEYLSSNNSNYTAINNCIVGNVLTEKRTGNSAYERYENAVIMGSKNSVIPTNGVTAIASDAFYGNNSITSISIPSNISYIYNGAFASCSNLETVYLYDRVYIRWNAFGSSRIITKVFYDSSKGSVSQYKSRISSDGNSNIRDATWVAM